MRLIDAEELLINMSAGGIPIMQKGISGVTGDEMTIKDYIDAQPTAVDLKNLIEILDRRIGTQSNILSGISDPDYRYGYIKILEAYQWFKLMLEELI